MFDDKDLVRCKISDLGGKVLELHYAYERAADELFGYYCLYGWEKETGKKYLISIECEK